MKELGESKYTLQSYEAYGVFYFELKNDLSF